MKIPTEAIASIPRADERIAAIAVASILPFLLSIPFTMFVATLHFSATIPPRLAKPPSPRFAPGRTVLTFRKGFLESNDQW